MEMESENQVTDTSLPSVGAMFRQSMHIWKQNLPYIFKIFLAPVILVLITPLLFDLFAGYFPALTILLVILIIAAQLFLIFAINGFITQIPVLRAGEKRGDAELYKIGARLFFPLLWVGILSMLAIIGGTVFFIIPAIFLVMYFVFYSFAVVLDGKRGLAALVYCWNIGKKHWWIIFIRYFVITLFSIAISLMFFIIAGLIALLIGKIVFGLGLSAGTFEAFFDFIEQFSDENVHNLVGTELYFKYVSDFIIAIFSIAASVFFIAPLNLIFVYLLYEKIKTKVVAVEESVEKKRRRWLTFFGWLGVVACIFLFAALWALIILLAAVV